MPTYFSRCKVAPSPLSLATKTKWTLQFVLKFGPMVHHKEPKYTWMSVWDDNTNFIQNGFNQGK